MQEEAITVRPVYHVLILTISVIFFVFVCSTIFQTLITNGTNLNDMSLGRISLPIWIWYLIGYTAVAVFFITTTLPWTKYLRRGFILKLKDQSIDLGNSSIQAASIVRYFVKGKGIAVYTATGSVFLHTGWSKGGTDAVISKLDEWC